jgi:hypothetical protein
VTLGASAPLVLLRHDWSVPVERSRRHPSVVLGPQRDGNEQRLSLSSVATDTMTYRLIAGDMRGQFTAWYDAETIRQLVPSATDALVRMPRWEDEARVDTAVSAGATTIPCDPSDKPLYVAGSEVLLWRDPQTYEVATIDTVGGSSIDVVDPLANDWGAGTILAPITPCRVVLPLDLTNWVPSTAGAQTFVVECSLADIAGVGTGGSSTTTTAAAISVSNVAVGSLGRAPIYATVTDASGLVIPGDGIVWSTSDPINAPVTNTADPAVAMVGNPNAIDSSATITATLGALSANGTADLLH